MNKRLIESEILVCGGETKLEAVWNVATRHDGKKEAPSSVIETQPPEQSRRASKSCAHQLRHALWSRVNVLQRHNDATRRGTALKLFARVAVNASEAATVLTDFYVEHRDGISAFSQKMASEEYYCISCQHWQPSLSRRQEKKNDAQKA